jgi:hypothetical protein
VNTTMEVITTPRKKRMAIKKKLTPRKANNWCCQEEALYSMLLYDAVRKLWTSVCVFAFLDKPCMAEIMCVGLNQLICVGLNLILCCYFIYWYIMYSCYYQCYLMYLIQVACCQNLYMKGVDAFSGRTHECARSRGRRKFTRRASQHGPV